MTDSQSKYSVMHNLPICPYYLSPALFQHRLSSCVCAHVPGLHQLWCLYPCNKPILLFFCYHVGGSLEDCLFKPRAGMGPLSWQVFRSVLQASKTFVSI